MDSIRNEISEGEPYTRLEGIQRTGARKGSGLTEISNNLH